MIAVESICAPALFVAPITGKTYVIPAWQEVPAGTTLNDITWVRSLPVKSNITIKHIGKYILHIYDNGKVTCDCPGFTFRKKCKHSAEHL